MKRWVTAGLAFVMLLGSGLLLIKTDAGLTANASALAVTVPSDLPAGFEAPSTQTSGTYYRTQPNWFANNYWVDLGDPAGKDYAVLTADHKIEMKASLDKSGSGHYGKSVAYSLKIKRGDDPVVSSPWGVSGALPSMGVYDNYQSGEVFGGFRNDYIRFILSYQNLGITQPTWFFYQIDSRIVEEPTFVVHSQLFRVLVFPTGYQPALKAAPAAVVFAGQTATIAVADLTQTVLPAYQEDPNAAGSWQTTGTALQFTPDLQAAPAELDVSAAFSVPFNYQQVRDPILSLIENPAVEPETSHADGFPIQTYATAAPVTVETFHAPPLTIYTARLPDVTADLGTSLTISAQLPAGLVARNVRWYLDGVAKTQASDDPNWYLENLTEADVGHFYSVADYYTADNTLVAAGVASNQAQLRLTAPLTVTQGKHLLISGFNVPAGMDQDQLVIEKSPAYAQVPVVFGSQPLLTVSGQTVSAQPHPEVVGSAVNLPISVALLDGSGDFTQHALYTVGRLFGQQIVNDDPSFWLQIPQLPTPALQESAETILEVRDVGSSATFTPVAAASIDNFGRAALSSSVVAANGSEVRARIQVPGDEEVITNTVIVTHTQPASAFDLHVSSHLLFLTGGTQTATITAPTQTQVLPVLPGTDAPNPEALIQNGVLTPAATGLLEILAVDPTSTPLQSAREAVFVSQLADVTAVSGEAKALTLPADLEAFLSAQQAAVRWYQVPESGPRILLGTGLETVIADPNLLFDGMHYQIEVDGVGDETVQSNLFQLHVTAQTGLHLESVPNFDFGQVVLADLLHGRYTGLTPLDAASDWLASTAAPLVVSSTEASSWQLNAAIAPFEHAEMLLENGAVVLQTAPVNAPTSETEKLWLGAGMQPVASGGPNTSLIAQSQAFLTLPPIKEIMAGQYLSTWTWELVSGPDVETPV